MSDTKTMIRSWEVKQGGDNGASFEAEGTHRIYNEEILCLAIDGWTINKFFSVPIPNGCIITIEFSKVDLGFVSCKNTADPEVETKKLATEIMKAIWRDLCERSDVDPSGGVPEKTREEIKKTWTEIIQEKLNG
jgi:hypothetical protein